MNVCFCLFVSLYVCVCVCVSFCPSKFLCMIAYVCVNV